MSGRGRSDRRGYDLVDIREILVNVSLPFVRNRALVGAFPIAAVELLHHVHARSNLPERSKALPIERRVIPQIDK